jgi:hypothetical protein
MNDVLVNALAARVNAGLMGLEQVPIPYRGAVQSKIEGGDIKKVYDA